MGRVEVELAGCDGSFRRKLGLVVKARIWLLSENFVRWLEAGHLVLVKAIKLLFVEEHLQLFALAMAGIVLVKLPRPIR